MANKVQLTLGFLAENVEVKTAVSDDNSDTELKTVCIGEGELHAPVRINQIVKCPTCTKTASSHWGFTSRARENTDGSLTVLSAEDLAGAVAGPEVTHKIELTRSPVEDVVKQTLPFGKFYYLAPGKGAGKVYNAFVLLVQEAEAAGQTYCAMFAIRTAPAMYRLGVIDGCLTIAQLSEPGTMKARPSVDLPQPTDADMTVARQLAELQSMPFDPARFADQRKVYLARKLGETDAVPAGIVEGEVVADVSPFALAQAAAIAAGKITPVNEPVKKAAPRKRAAKKPPATVTALKDKKVG